MKIGISILQDGGVLFEGIDPLLHKMLTEIRTSAAARRTPKATILF